MTVTFPDWVQGSLTELQHADHAMRNTSTLGGIQRASQVGREFGRAPDDPHVELIRAEKSLLTCNGWATLGDLEQAGDHHHVAHRHTLRLMRAGAQRNLTDVAAARAEDLDARQQLMLFYLAELNGRPEASSHRAENLVAKLPADSEGSVIGLTRWMAGAIKAGQRNGADAAFREHRVRYGDDLAPASASEESNACFVRWNAIRLAETDPEEAEVNLEFNATHQEQCRRCGLLDTLVTIAMYLRRGDESFRVIAMEQWDQLREESTRLGVVVPVEYFRREILPSLRGS